MKLIFFILMALRIWSSLVKLWWKIVLFPVFISVNFVDFTSLQARLPVFRSMTTYASPTNEMLGFFVPWITSMIQYVIGLVDYYSTSIMDILDYYIPGWKLVILSPFVITFVILPTLIVIYLYISALLLYVYRRRHAIYEGFQEHSLSQGYKKMIGVLWSGHGWIWHGYEVEGMENIPSGPALIVYYHGAIPIDVYYLNAALYLEKNRILCSVIDNFVFKVPGLAKFFQFWGCFPGPRNKVVELLRAGQLVSVAPGGVREALFSENYATVWGKRQGFAKAALEANVPIIPVFTENIREAFDYIKTGRGFFRRMYERTRLPVLPLYGGFPVKLKTHIGRPIYSNKDTTPGELVIKTRKALDNLIKRYQRKPGSILLSFVERFTTKSVKEVEILPLEGMSESSEVSSEGDQESTTAENNCSLSCKKMKISPEDNSEFRTSVLCCQCYECKNINKMKNYPSQQQMPVFTSTKHDESSAAEPLIKKNLDSNKNCMSC